MNNALLAKPIIDGKFWILEKHGQKIATIQMLENGRVVLVDSETTRTIFPGINTLSTQCNIRFEPNPTNKINTKITHTTHLLYGFPSNGTAYNVLYDVVKKLPVFTKTKCSKSYYCAGYYVIDDSGYEIVCCPKLITLNRIKFFGPFKNKDDAIVKLNTLQLKV